MADSWRGLIPRAASPAVIRFAEIPASSKIWVSPQDARAALPSEPLARVVKVNKISLRFLMNLACPAASPRKTPQLRG